MSFKSLRVFNSKIFLVAQPWWATVSVLKNWCSSYWQTSLTLPQWYPFLQDIIPIFQYLDGPLSFEILLLKCALNSVGFQGYALVLMVVLQRPQISSYIRIVPFKLNSMARCFETGPTPKSWRGPCSSNYEKMNSFTFVF